MGRWSARLAPPFLDFAHDRGARRRLDLGCGTGTLSPTLPPETHELKHKLRQMVLGERPDGRFTMTARAFAVRGRVPQG